MTEADARKLSAKLRGRPSSELANGAVWCLTCRSLPSLSWWRGMKRWTCSCDCMPEDVVITGDTLAVAIAKWNKRNEKAT